MRISEARKALKDKILQVLNDNTVGGKPLSRIKTINYGDRLQSGNLKLPAIWIIPAAHAPELVNGRQEWHDFRYQFVAVVQNTKYELGVEEAEDLASEIYDVLNAAKSNEFRNIAFDVRPTRIEPSYDMGNNTNVYLSLVQFDFRVNIR